jgi:hypothetical protein
MTDTPENTTFIPPTPTPAEQVMEHRLTITVNGERLTYWPRRVTVALAAECRRVTGMSTANVFAMACRRTENDVDVFAALAWLALRQNGRTVDYTDFTSELTFAELEKWNPDLEDVPVDPKADEA